MTCWECGHPEDDHRNGLGCAATERTEEVIHHDDGAISAHVDLTVCGCPYFKASTA